MATYEVDIPKDSEEEGTEQCDGDDLSDMFTGTATEGDFISLQRYFYQKYKEHKKYSQYIWEAMHTTFPITSTRAIISKLPTGEDGEAIEPSIFR